MDVRGLERLMNQGWIVTRRSLEEPQVQIGFATEGESGTSVPDLSIEEAGRKPEYGPMNEPWGVRDFHGRDALGKLIDILFHSE